MESRQDSLRTLGDIRIEIQRRHQPPGWAWVRVNDLNGVQLFAGVVPEDELTLDVMQQVERYRAYQNAEEVQRVERHRGYQNAQEEAGRDW